MTESLPTLSFDSDSRATAAARLACVRYMDCVFRSKLLQAPMGFILRCGALILEAVG